MDTMVPETETYPEYLDALADNSEAAIRQRITELEAEIERLRTSLEESRKTKQILGLTGVDLRNELLRFLSEGLNLPTRPREDVPGRRRNDANGFWLVAAAVGEEWCFGEVVDSPNGNVTRAHLAKVMVDRAEAGKSDDFPAMLVVNTFTAKTTLEDRDQPVASDVVKRAAEDHILVVRALDLVRLRQKEQSGFAGISDFHAKLRESGGWYEVNSSLASKLSKS